MQENVVIVGGGQAAAQAVTNLRSDGFEGSITLVSDEAYHPYQRPPLSKKMLAGEVAADRLLLKPPRFYEQNGVDVRLNTRATAIDRENHMVVLADAPAIPFGKLLLATGSRPRPIPVSGADLPGIFYLRSLADVSALRPELSAGSKLVIVGGGYIGLEVAAIARSLGVEVHLVEAASRLLARVASPAISDFYLETHRARGVEIALDMAVHGFWGTGRVEGVQLGDERTVPADLVLVCIGAIPNSELAQEAGLTVEGGILVDDHARTSDPDIYAVGDCAAHRSPIYGSVIRLESVHNAIEQAKAASAGMTGKHRPYHTTPWFWSDQYEFKLQSAGLLIGAERSEVIGSLASGSFSVRHFIGDALRAVECVNDPATFMTSRAALNEALVCTGATAPTFTE
ncbi:FAD-dependent oxidoreductase [Rhizorhabdus dicambivorans]|uniref:DsmC n=1 Tax=Rhizorhabdus dicambivorans TaxID=1850238 RepID=A0A2H4ZC38_9SPHN|nr:FAD-dependent oxidoreductase [Rhizorhabdus dicambivorans]AUF73406.1 DsmC [Rhizorhabdus dicambivorans]